MRSSSTSTTWSMIRVWASWTEEKSVASPSLWKKQSTTLVPPAAGRLIGRHSRPNCSRISSSTASGFASRASILLMTTIRHRPRSRAASIMRCDIGSTPATALTTTAAVSTASSTGSVRPMKSGKPGVSIRLTWAWPVSSQQTVASIECCRRRACGIVVRDGGAADQAALGADGAGREQKRLSQQGFSRPGVSHQGHVSEVAGCLRHAVPRLSCAGRFFKKNSTAGPCWLAPSGVDGQTPKT